MFLSRASIADMTPGNDDGDIQVEHVLVSGMYRRAVTNFAFLHRYMLSVMMTD